MAVLSGMGQIQTSLDAAYALRSAAQPAAAIAMAQSWLGTHTLSPFDTARALNLEGICYEDMGEGERAIHALEEAQRLLGAKDSDELGAVLDNLGRVYAANGDLGNAARLYKSAFRIAEELGEHGAMARVANNQADIALEQGHDREARKYLQRADGQAKQAPELDNDALAAIASMKGWLALQENDARGALIEYQEALCLWRQLHGERHPLTAWGMLLVGKAQAKNGDPEGGAKNMRDAIAMLASTLGEKSRRYAAAEVAYAGVLEQMGEREEALHLRRDAQATETMLRPAR